MRIYKCLAVVLLASCLFTKCGNREDQRIVKTTTAMSAIDSISKGIFQAFGLPCIENTNLDSGSLVFYCSRAYDTSSLIEIKQQKKSIRGVYYEILPEYHRFVTDYADTSAKLIFFEGYSFTVDTITWRSVTDLAKAVLREREGLNENLKYTDGAAYALYYNGQSRHGNSNDETSFVKFDRFLKRQFLDRYKQLRKPLMHKGK